MPKDHNFFMKLALNKAWQYQLLTYPNPAVGACVVKDNQVLSVEAHYKAGEPHAEVNALKVAYLSKYQNSPLKQLTSSHDIHNFLSQNHNDFFKDCEIYVTLEPCNHTGKTPACASLLEAVQIQTVYIGSLDPNKQASGGLQRLQNANINVITNICEKEANDLLLPFIKWQEDQFIFFKLAMRKDGSVDGGYITTKQSLTHVHKIRTLINTLLIGGNTVRIDRPTLDSRFIDNCSQNPDILIYSNQKEFDKTIPLFNIKNRSVTISNNLKDIKDDNFIMCEGGYSLLNTLKDDIDFLMVFISKEETDSKEFNVEELGFKIIYIDETKKDTIIWLKR